MTTPAPSVDPDTFRRLLGSFASGVTVLTTVDAAGAPAGMTASAVASVSLDPPLLLACVAKDAEFHRAMAAAGTFVVHVLGADQARLSERFAAKGSDKFAGVDYALDRRGLPILREALATIVCEHQSAVDAGDHTIFIGRVTGGDATAGRPLLHFRGTYHSLP